MMLRPMKDMGLRTASRDDLDRLRIAVREFVAGELAEGTFQPRCDSWLNGFTPAFSRKLGARGWIGMTWPCQYGGGERPALERYVVTEELLAAGAPVAAHWLADRQVGPAMIRHGTAEQRDRYLPAMIRGEYFVSVALSEPDSGSDLASLRTSARRTAAGWLLTGTKLWTSHVHQAHLVVVLCRTSVEADRHLGLSQLMVEVGSPGLTIRPVKILNGEHHFNELILDNVFIPDSMVLGDIGAGWQQITEELAFERSGPERFLSTFPLLQEVVPMVNAGQGDTQLLGRCLARLTALRCMSMEVAASIDATGTPDAVLCAAVKDLGTRFEQDVIDTVRSLIDPAARSARTTELLDGAVLSAPGFTIRGGTNEILRGIIAKASRIPR